MLCLADITRLRESVKRLASRRSWSRPPVWMVMHGGPLDGMKMPMEIAPSQGSSIGMCVVTSTGPVQALYRPDEHGELRFAGCESPTMTAFAYPKN